MAKREMQILTIDEAAAFLRLSRRTLYRLKDIPRVRYAGKLVYVREDLEEWVRGRMESPLPAHMATLQDTHVDKSRTVRHHRNSVYVLPTDRAI
jgi:excisionase family DNA binding protein